MKPRVYCAGPLFNACEKREMTQIADRLEACGYPVYLPHRDGMEFKNVLPLLVPRGYEPAEAAEFLHKSIFALDVYQLAVACDAMVWNLNGRVPDEGAVSEAAIAWTLGKPLVAYSDDARCLIEGRFNPLLVGLVDFEHTDDLDELPLLLAEAIDEIAADDHTPAALEDMPRRFRQTVRDGEVMWNLLSDRGAAENNLLIADTVEELFAPKREPALV
ncbi:nucleoside 2-deoxyribosyltransferase [Alienimonas sp. DA493]|uniref:nucleoside 2-deoxyribosyltransferase n=1 Tax=Alienimonas sp. DA493 TaxID=3373605 RepID=UPI00375440FC